MHSHEDERRKNDKGCIGSGVAGTIGALGSMPAIGIVSTGHDAKELAAAERVIHQLKELTPELLSGLVKEHHQ